MDLLDPWVPAFAGMTNNTLSYLRSVVLSVLINRLNGVQSILGIFDVAIPVIN